MATDTGKQTLGFQAEVRQLLDLVVHSLYSNKEIFLRELISNASDAADKLRFEALGNDALYEGDTDLRIQVSYDKDARTVTVSDNGIGMSSDEVVQNIGTIAKSGTREFLASLSGDQARDAHLVGQFGVGFYSAFIVADRVTLVTRRAGVEESAAVRWESDGQGEYTLEPARKAGRGTDVILHLKSGEDEFLDPYRLRTIIRKYSDHIPLPVEMPVEGKQEHEMVNRAAALWTRPRNEIKPEEYDEFYKHIAHDFECPLAHVHSHVEGKQEYTLLLYIPARPPLDLMDRDRRHGIKLYIRRVFVMDDAEQIMPGYLRFIRGIVDSNDLPLNVSREILQRSRDIDAIRNGAVRKVLDLLADIAEKDSEKYGQFWKNFGILLKEGVIEDPQNQERIAKLLRFASTKTEGGEQTVSLSDYVGRMSSGQDKIYYVTSENHDAARNSPHLEIFRKKGIEVLLLTDRIDEWLVSHLHEFGGKALQSVAKGDLDLGALEGKEERSRQEQTQAEFKDLLARIKKSLGERVTDVRITHRLTDSPACLVTDADAIGTNLERLLRSAGQPAAPVKPILEINPAHAFVQRLQDERDDTRFGDWTHVLFDQAVLSEGGQIKDPASFVRRLNGILFPGEVSHPTAAPG
ncbi:MAG: molecular chaperone HtpG [Acidiferrobacteraceae bacterium]